MLELKKVLTAVDFSPATAPLLECLEDFRTVGMESVTLLHVLEVRYDRRPPVEHREMYETMLVEHAEELRIQGFTVDTRIEAGRPPDEIVRCARSEEADLILLASRGHNLLERLLVGSTAAEVLRTTSTPVLLDRIEPSDDGPARCATVCTDKFARPLLATDFSASANGAEEAAASLSEHAESAVFMTVRDTGESAITAEHARSNLETLSEKAACPVTVRVEQSERASSAIVRVAEEEESTLLIVGKHGRGYLEEKLIGSTAGNLAKHGERSVLMVPGGAAPTGGSEKPVVADEKSEP